MPLRRSNVPLLMMLAAYSYLFYQQNAGINFLLFNFLLIALLLTQQPELFKSSLWRWLVFGSLLSSTCVAWLGTDLAITANVISLLTLVGYSFQPDASFLVAGVQAIHSLLTAPFRKLYQFFEESLQGRVPVKPSAFHQLYSYGWPIVITLVFFALYWSANTNFAATLSRINLDFISPDWLIFMLGGFLLLFGAFYREILPTLVLFDVLSRDKLSSRELDYSPGNVSLQLENNRSVVLLAMLNGLLLLVNLNDLVYFFSNTGIPVDSTYAEYVHQGVYTLILTVLMAIGLLFYYFRGDQHFYLDNRRLLTLAYGWVIQNAVLLLITAYKNNWYVEEYGLTYKRIGVYVYLLLTFIGLVTTLFKLYQAKSVWFLIRKNSWAFYTVLVLGACLNWDRLITEYNLHQARVVDVNYLLTLSDAALPELTAIKDNPAYGVSPIQKMRIENRRQAFLRQTEQQSWQSWNYDGQRVKKALNESR